MFGFQGVKLPPFFELQKFFGKYLFKTVKFEAIMAWFQYLETFSVVSCQHHRH